MKNKILVVVAHPDDEVLGAGGTLIKHAKAGDEIYLLMLGEGETSREGIADIKKREAQAKAVSKRLNAKEIMFECFPDQRFDSVPLLEITQKIEKILYKIKTNIIITNCPYDLNMDHRLVFQAALTAARPAPECPVKKFLSFETLSSTEWQMKDQANSFCPTMYVDISKVINEKIELLKFYKDELRDYPHPRSVEGVKTLAHYRGMETGFRYAEAFQVIRLLEE